METMRSSAPGGSEADHEPQKSAKRRPGRPTLATKALLDRVLDLFLERGFEGTSIDAITAAAGVAKRTIYLRYGDKDSLFKAALKQAIEEWIVPVERLRAAEAGDLEETLRNVTRILITNIMTPSGLRLLRITNVESSRRPEIGAYTYKYGTERTIAYLADLFRRRIGRANVPTDEWRGAAIAFLNSVISGPPTQSAWGLMFDEQSIERHIVYSVRLFLFGLLPRDSAQADATSMQASPATSSTSQDEQRTAVDPARLRQLEEENQLLRKLLVDTMLEKASNEHQVEAQTGLNP